MSRIPSLSQFQYPATTPSTYQTTTPARQAPLTAYQSPLDSSPSAFESMPEDPAWSAQVSNGPASGFAGSATVTQGQQALLNALNASEGPTCSIRGAATTLSALADHVYDMTQPPPAGFELAGSWDLGYTGLQAGIYKGSLEGRDVVVVSFRGTESNRGFFETLKDWGTDAASAVTLPGQYIEGQALMHALKEKFPDRDFVITGHSLGGGVGAFAAMLEGVPAVVFNAAGPQAAGYLTMGVNSLFGHSPDSLENIIQVNSTRDCLTQGIGGLLAGRDWVDSKNVYEIETTGFAGDGRCDHHGIAVTEAALAGGKPLIRSNQPDSAPFVGSLTDVSGVLWSRGTWKSPPFA